MNRFQLLLSRFNLRRYDMGVAVLNGAISTFLAVIVLGKAVEVDPIRPTLKAPGTKRLKQKNDGLLSSFAFKFNLRRYSWGFRRRTCSSPSSSSCSCASSSAGAYTRPPFSST
jgi:hypothetical protein